jgi:hypothetical protein
MKLTPLMNQLSYSLSATKNCLSYLKLMLIFLFCSYAAAAQIVYPIQQQDTTPQAFLNLLYNKEQIEANDTLNEKIVDLVRVFLVDSMIEHKKQHHKVGPIGWFIHTFGGFNWRAYRMKKEKVVGTIVRQSRSSKEEFTEYDINFDLNFHLDKYLHRVFGMYDRQASIKRQDIRPRHKKNYKMPPFVRDSNNIDIRLYRLHCELTPEKAYRAPLNYLFYPTLPKAGGLDKHPNFESSQPTVGFYGTLCLDCNHSCHPEMHPYEWMWWLKCAEKETISQKEWFFGLFHEGSNRQKKWSVNPMIGQISLPFIFRKDAGMRIQIKHGVLHQFKENYSVKGPLNHPVFDASQISRILQMESKGMAQQIQLEFDKVLQSNGLKYWLSNLNYDADKELFSGYFNVHLAVQDVYTASILFETKK